MRKNTLVGFSSALLAATLIGCSLQSNNVTALDPRQEEPVSDDSISTVDGDGDIATIIDFFDNEDFLQGSSRIIGGRPVNISRYPYLGYVSVTRGTRRGYCGGTLIRPDWVLTAAHCVDRNTTQVDVIFGRTNVLSSSTGEVVPALRWIIHPSYSGSRTLNNDVALIQLSRPVNRPFATLPTQSSAYTNLSGTAVGWGRTSAANINSGSETQLREAQLPIVSNNVCANYYRRNLWHPNNMICVAGNEPIRNICNGDSGGPLLISGIQVGITSFGPANGCTAGPGVFARVSTYISWINAQVGSGSTTPPPLPGSSIRVPQTLRGTLTASDPIDPLRRRGRYRDYSLTGVSEGQTIQIDLVGGTRRYDPYLQLIDLNTGRRVAFNDDFGGTLNSRITYRVQAGQRLVIRVSGFNNNVGSFTLSTTLVGGTSSMPVPGSSIRVPQTLRGTLTASDPIDPLRRRGRYRDYSLTGVSAGQTIQIDLVGGTRRYDPYLQLIDLNTGRRVAFNDDFGGTLNSRITYRVRAGQRLAIRVSGFNNNVGSFSLSTVFVRSRSLEEVSDPELDLEAEIEKSDAEKDLQ